MSVLEVQDLTIRFGGLAAVDGLSLQVNEWEIVGLMGPNGAGKTSAFNCITGFYKPTGGKVIYRGEDVTRTPPYRKAALGIGRTFQNVGMVRSETVLENLLTAQHTHCGYGAFAAIAGATVVRQRERELTERAEAILELLGLSAIRNRRLDGLSYGTLKLLELGCALATDPDLLLLDEPSSGMGPEEAHELGGRLLALRRELGVTMLLIEHHVPLVAQVCDYVYVLDFGKLLAEGDATEVRRHPAVIAAYLGTEETAERVGVRP
jgi:branched-chain amino acid transport system ATP-binding protein